MLIICRELTVYIFNCVSINIKDWVFDNSQIQRKLDGQWYFKSQLFIVDLRFLGVNFCLILVYLHSYKLFLNSPEWITNLPSAISDFMTRNVKVPVVSFCFYKIKQWLNSLTHLRVIVRFICILTVDRSILEIHVQFSHTTERNQILWLIYVVYQYTHPDKVIRLVLRLFLHTNLAIPFPGSSPYVEL